MAISPPSDIILDVARAADPLSYRAAAEKLTSLGIGAAGTASEFADVLRSAGQPELSLPFDPASTLVELRNREAIAGSADGRRPIGAAEGATSGAYERFEAFVLQSFVQSMLPRDAETVFGPGNTGEIWKSMMAEQLAAQLAEAGGIGIAEKVLAAQPSPQEPFVGHAGII